MHPKRTPLIALATLSAAALLPAACSLFIGRRLLKIEPPFLLGAILFSYFGLQRRKWQQGGKD